MISPYTTFDNSSPISRFRVYGEGVTVRKTVTDIVSDCVTYLKVSCQPVANRMFRAFCGLLRQLTRETTILFRVTVLIAIISL